MSKSPTRYDKARPNIEILSVISSVMDEPHPMDWIVMYTIRAWSMITISGVHMGHLVATICKSENELGFSIRRLRKKGYVAYDQDTKYIAITKEGSKKLLSFQGKRSMIWDRVHAYSNSERALNFTRNKHKTDGQTETDDQDSGKGAE